MKASFITLSLALTCVLTSVMSLSIKRTGNRFCDDAEALETSTIAVGNNIVNLTTFSCNSFLKREFTSGSLTSRSTGECTNPDECQCGQDLACGCTSDTPEGPDPSDCTILIDAIDVVSQVNGATFFVQPGNFLEFNYDSCGIYFQNFIDSTVEYCWDELSFEASIWIQECIEPVQSTSAECDANDGAFSFQVFKSSA